MKKLFYFAAILLILASCSKDETELDRDKFIGTYSGTQYIEVYIDDELFGTANSVGIISIELGSFDDQIIIEKGSLNEVNATVIGSSLTINTQPVSLLMNDEIEIFSTTGNGILSGSDLEINYDMRATIDGVSYRNVVQQILVKD